MKILIKDEKGAGKPRPLEEGYADEEQLQEFLRNDAELIPVEEIELGSPPLLCIGSEVRKRGKSDSATTEGWLDLLYVDESARLTIIEAKLGKNAESHREVVGQILEYAAFASSWTGSDLEERAASFFGSPECPAEYSGLQLQETLTKFLEAQDSHEEKAFDYEEFIDELENKINNGRMRLVVAIDEPPDSLIRIVQFVNQFSVHFDLYVFQLKRFHDSDGEQDIFVPAIYGRVNRATATRRSQPRDWDYSSFFKELEDRDEETQTYVTKAYEAFREWTDEELWGSGGTYGSFNLVVRNGDLRVNLAAITTSGILYVNFGGLSSKVPEEVIDALKGDLESIEGVSFPAGIARKYPRVPEVGLRDPVKLRAVLKAIKRVVDSIHGLDDN